MELAVPVFRQKPRILTLKRANSMRTCPSSWVLAACTTVCTLLAPVACTLAQFPYIRPLVSELESNPSILPTNPPTEVQALLQAKISASRTGRYWTAEVFNGNGAITSDALIAGTQRQIYFALSRGQNIPGLNVATDAGPSGIDSRQLITNAGDISMSVNLVGNTNDEAIIRFTRATNAFEFTAREGSPIPGIAGEFFGGDMEQRELLSDGRVVFYNSATTGALPSSSDDFIFVQGSPVGVVVQTGFTPANQAGTPVPIQSIRDEFATSADGSQSIYLANLNLTANSQVAVLNGSVVLQQGQTLPGTPGEFNVAARLTDVRMSPGGRWAVWGRGSDTGAEWLVVDGVRIFGAEDDLPGALSGERINTIFDLGFTTRGDLWFVALTSTFRYVVIVVPVNTTDPPRVVFESGTLVDLNNNDDAFDDDIFGFLGGWFEGDRRADSNGIDGLGVPDIFAFLGFWFAGCN